MEEGRRATLTRTRVLWSVLVLGVALATLTLAIPAAASAQAPSAPPQPQCPSGCIALTYSCTNGAYSISGIQQCHDASGWKWFTMVNDVSLVATPDSGHTFSHWSSDCTIGGSNSNPTTLTITGSCYLYAYFN